MPAPWQIEQVGQSWRAVYDAAHAATAAWLMTEHATPRLTEKLQALSVALTTLDQRRLATFSPAVDDAFTWKERAEAAEAALAARRAPPEGDERLASWMALQDALPPEHPIHVASGWRTMLTAVVEEDARLRAARRAPTAALIALPTVAQLAAWLRERPHAADCNLGKVTEYRDDAPYPEGHAPWKMTGANCTCETPEEVAVYLRAALAAQS